MGPAVRRVADPEDIVQEVSVIAARCFPALRASGGVLTWFLRFAEKRIRSTARRSAPSSCPRRSLSLPPGAVVTGCDADLAALPCVIPRPESPPLCE